MASDQTLKPSEEFHQWLDKEDWLENYLYSQLVEVLVDYATIIHYTRLEYVSVEYGLNAQTYSDLMHLTQQQLKVE